MSLIDLKKSQGGQVKKKNFTIDEFICDAEEYAKGAPKIVSELSPDGEKHKLSLRQAIRAVKHHVGLAAIEHPSAQEIKVAPRNKGEKPFRRATFTLSEEAIEQLHDLSEGTELAKSHILRILIDELCNKEQNEKLTKLLQSRIG